MGKKFIARRDSQNWRIRKKEDEKEVAGNEDKEK